MLEQARSDIANRLQAKDVVWRQLRQSIICLDFAVGAPLREADLAARYGVSKTPIREALVRLEKEGLVEILKFRGARVRGYTTRDVRELYDLRELLEGFCARRAALGISADDEALLRKNVVRSRKLLTLGDIDSVADKFDEFDELLCRQVQNHRVFPLIDDLTAHLDRLGRMTVKIPGRVENSIDQHEAIVMAISKRDPEAAESACRAHVRSVLGDLMDTIQLDWNTEPDER